MVTRPPNEAQLQWNCYRWRWRGKSFYAEVDRRSGSMTDEHHVDSRQESSSGRITVERDPSISKRAAYSFGYAPAPEMPVSFATGSPYRAARSLSDFGDQHIGRSTKCVSGGYNKWTVCAEMELVERRCGTRRSHRRKAEAVVAAVIFAVLQELFLELLGEEVDPERHDGLSAAPER